MKMLDVETKKIYEYAGLVNMNDIKKSPLTPLESLHKPSDIIMYLPLTDLHKKPEPELSGTALLLAALKKANKELELLRAKKKRKAERKTGAGIGHKKIKLDDPSDASGRSCSSDEGQSSEDEPPPKKKTHPKPPTHAASPKPSTSFDPASPRSEAKYYKKDAFQKKKSSSKPPPTVEKPRNPPTVTKSHSKPPPAVEKPRSKPPPAVEKPRSKPPPAVEKPKSRSHSKSPKTADRPHGKSADKPKSADRSHSKSPTTDKPKSPTTDKPKSPTAATPKSPDSPHSKSPTAADTPPRKLSRSPSQPITRFSPPAPTPIEEKLVEEESIEEKPMEEEAAPIEEVSLGTVHPPIEEVSLGTVPPPIGVESPRCVLCQSAHVLYTCPVFESMSVLKRMEFVQTNKLCFKCLFANCQAENCLFGNCLCGEPHNIMIHPQDIEPMEFSTLPSGLQGPPPGLPAEIDAAITHFALSGDIETGSEVILDEKNAMIQESQQYTSSKNMMNL